MNTSRLGVPAVLLAMALSLVAGAPAAAHGDGHRLNVRDLVDAYVASARYHRLASATQAGYGRLPEGAPLHECIDEDVDLDDEDGKPAMGVHFVNGSLLDDRVAADEPEVLVYEPLRSGRMRLVALEYVIFESAWGSPEQTQPPELFGHEFMYVAAPNRYDLPAFYALHAWIWKHNPDGRFEGMNPRVTCAHADQADTRP